MPSHHSYDFHRLPGRLKQQLASAIADGGNHLQEETSSNALFYVLRGAGLILVAWMAWLLMANSFGDPGKDELWEGTGLIIGFALYIGAFTYLLLAACRT